MRNNNELSGNTIIVELPQIDNQRELGSEVATITDQLRQTFEKVKSSSREIIYQLSLTAERKDEDTGGHLQRMSHYTAAVARKLGLSEEAIEAIIYASPMHDVGKIGIPDYILLKPGKLDSNEWGIMKNHCILGVQILEGSSAGFIGLAATIARTHHEKWDGSGYPNGLKGCEIPLVGRITAIADVFDALTSKRPYKNSYSMNTAFTIIRESRGTHFDPQVVDAFLAIEEEILSIKNKHNDDFNRGKTRNKVNLR